MMIFWGLFIRSPLLSWAGKQIPPRPPEDLHPTSWVGPCSHRAPVALHKVKPGSELPTGMADIVLMQPSFLGKVLTTLSAGEGARSRAGLMCLAVPPQRSSLPKRFATVRTGEGGLGSGGCSRQGGPGGWAVAALVGNEGLGGGEGASTGEADEEGPP